MTEISLAETSHDTWLSGLERAYRDGWPIRQICRAFDLSEDQVDQLARRNSGRQKWEFLSATEREKV